MTGDQEDSVSGSLLVQGNPEAGLESSFVCEQLALLCGQSQGEADEQDSSWDKVPSLY